MTKSINWTLYFREIKRNRVLLAVFGAVVAMYVSVIINIYGSNITDMISTFGESVEDLIAAMGITIGGEPTLVEFMANFLYGFVLAVFPMAFVIINANRLIAQYVDKGSMVSLVAAPVHRRTIALTQITVLITNTLIIIVFVTLVQITVCAAAFPGELEILKLLLLNTGLLSLLLFIGGICFLCSCLFSDTKYSLGVGAGIPALSFILQMLGNAGEQVKAAKYFTFFSLFDTGKIIAGNPFGITGIIILLCGSIVLYIGAVVVFVKKDLYI